MFLSIIIPVYNAEKYIKECLDSCLNQNLFYSEYEIICVDDVSTDNTPRILREYQEKYSNITVFFQEKNCRLGRNKGLELAKGEWVWFVDNDDFIHDNVLGELKNIAEITDCERIGFSVYEFSERLSDEEKEKYKNNTLNGNADYLVDSTAWACIMKREFLISNNITPRSNRITGRTYSIDTLFIYECKRAGITTELHFGKPLYFYRRNQYSGTLDKSYNRILTRFNGRVNVARLMLRDYCHDIEAYGHSNDITADYLISLLRNIMSDVSLMNSKDRKAAIKMLKDDSLYPIAIFPECTTTLKSITNNKKGFKRYLNFTIYYITTPIGFFLYMIPIRIHRMKAAVAKAVKQNVLFNRFFK